MDLKPSGGIFWRLDGSGNLTAYDTSGNTLGVFVGGFFSAKTNGGTAVTNGTLSMASSTQQSYGAGVTITLRNSGRVFTEAQIYINSSVANTAVNVYLYRTTGAVPAQGSAVSGTGLITKQFFTASTTILLPTVFMWTDTGPTNGTTYSYYFALSTSGGVDTVKLLIDSQLTIEV